MLVSMSGPGSRLYVSAGGGGGPDNPDSIPAATLQHMYETYATSSDRPPDYFTTPVIQDNYDFAYETGTAPGGGNCWRAIPKQNSQAGDASTPERWEGETGWPWSPSSFTVDTYKILVVDYYLWLSQQFCDDVKVIAPGAGYAYYINKLIDINMWNAAGNAADGNTRQIVQMLGYRDGAQLPPDGDGIYLAHVNGGGGGRYIYDGVNTPLDLSTKPGQFVWWRHVFDCRGSSAPNRSSRTYYKLSEDTNIHRNLVRTEDIDFGFGGTYEYAANDHGWHGANNGSYLYGYVGDVRPPANNGFDYDADRYLKIWGVKVANGWSDPPAGGW